MRRPTAIAFSVLATCGCLAAATDERYWATELSYHERRVAAATSEEERFEMLDGAAYAAFHVGELNKAQAYANDALKLADKHRDSWAYGNVIHHAHLIHGHLALAIGDVRQAIDELQASGATPGSPQLDSFGPDLSLAKALLEQGQAEAVLSYLEQCRKFWRMHADRLDEWKAEIVRGEACDFRWHPVPRADLNERATY